jgi:hypothetical protein
MKIKTSEATPIQIDYLVAKCEGVIWAAPDGELLGSARGMNYSTDWALAGPIIERECISVEKEGKFPWAAWSKAPFRDDAEAFGYGESPLIAAMRCYCCSKLGDAVEAPDDLTS